MHSSPSRARHLDARAFAALHPDGAPRDEAAVRAALALYEAIPADSGVAFVDFRRALGRAYCQKKLGDPAACVRLALDAAEHAADGGFVRLRVMALNLASRAAIEPDASRLRERARRLSAWLEDEDLLARVDRG